MVVKKTQCGYRKDKVVERKRLKVVKTTLLLINSDTSL